MSILRDRFLLLVLRLPMQGIWYVEWCTSHSYWVVSEWKHEAHKRLERAGYE